MKRIALNLVKTVFHKPVFDVQHEYFYLATCTYKMPKGYGNSIKANVKIKYNLVEGYSLPKKVFLCILKAQRRKIKGA